MAAKEGENGVKGFQFRKPINRTKWESFKKGVYDPSTREFLGRTGSSWGKLLAFYTMFYIVLAALFAICMQGLLATLDDSKPKWTLEKSLIGTNPGLGVRPISSKTEEGSLIWYNMKDTITSDKWIKYLDEFLGLYRKDQTGKNFQPCGFNQTAKPGNVCIVNLEHFGPCSPSNHYGYYSGSPCVFLKINKIYGWEPDYYTQATDEMPQELQEVISSINNDVSETNRTQASETNRSQQVWISCEGVNPIDKENVLSFGYFPERGFPSYYFPYTNTPNYLSPLIAVHVENPKQNVLISIECRAWAKNIKYRGGELERAGSISFEILLDDKDA